MLKMESHKRIKNCDKQNEQKQFNCINNFIQQKLGSNLPWLNASTNPNDFRGNQSLNDFVTIYWQILQHKLDNELRTFGCLLPNCDQKSWKAHPFAKYRKEFLSNSPDLEKAFSHENRTRHWITMFSHEVSFIILYYKLLFIPDNCTLQIQITEEFELYGFASFSADVGGLLGLFLGASILSIMETFSNMTKKYLTKL